MHHGINEICSERYDKLSKMMDLHEKRIDRLERDDAVSSAKITEMITIIDGLVKAVWGVVISVGGTALIILLGYVVQHVFGK